MTDAPVSASSCHPAHVFPLPDQIQAVYSDRNPVGGIGRIENSPIYPFYGTRFSGNGVNQVVKGRYGKKPRFDGTRSVVVASVSEVSPNKVIDSPSLAVYIVTVHSGAVLAVNQIEGAAKRVATDRSIKRALRFCARIAWHRVSVPFFCECSQTLPYGYCKTCLELPRGLYHG